MIYTYFRLWEPGNSIVLKKSKIKYYLKYNTLHILVWILHVKVIALRAYIIIMDEVPIANPDC